jgi:hypothetical protein
MVYVHTKLCENQSPGSKLKKTHTNRLDLCFPLLNNGNWAKNYENEHFAVLLHSQHQTPSGNSTVFIVMQLKLSSYVPCTLFPRSSYKSSILDYVNIKLELDESPVIDDLIYCKMNSYSRLESL